MSDPSTPPRADQPSWSREGLTVAISLIGAGASLNSWFPAFQVLGVILIVAGIVVLVAAIWPSARSFLHRHLQTRAHRLAAGGALVALVGIAGFAGMRLLPQQFQSLHLNALPAEETAPPFSLLDLLPEAEELPVDLVETKTDFQTGEALARLRSSGAEELMARMLEWDYDQNVFRIFERAVGATPTPHTMYLLEVSLHRLGSPAGADGALDWFADDRSALSKLPEVPVAQIGDEARAIAGEQEDADGDTIYREASVYFRQDRILVRVTARSQQANPLTVSIAVARFVVAKIPP